jgi:hypothetical protein
MGSIEFDVYDSDFPVCYSWNKAVDMVKEGKYPRLGEGMFRYYSSLKNFDNKIEKCENAKKIAGTFDDKYYLYETQVVLTYIQLAKTVYRAALASFEKQKNGKLINASPIIVELEKAKENNIKAIKNWRNSLGKESWHQRVYAAIGGTENTCDQIMIILKAFEKEK